MSEKLPILLTPKPITSAYEIRRSSTPIINSGLTKVHKNFILPFLSIDVVNEAREILKHIVKSMREEGNPFRGVIYGQFQYSQAYI